MSHRLFYVGLLAAVSANWVSAQSATDLDGKWEAKFVAAGGRSTGADVVFTGSEGTWRAHSAPRDNPCYGKETPMAVDRSSETLTVKILYSKLLAGCQDGQFSVKLVGGALKGQFGDGRPVELVRK